ncbi:MAG: aspartate-semialdehyde dehydrogenase [Rubricoccaceae bacterium]
MGRLRAGILGATGAVGQTFVRLLADHPLFEITALVASSRSAGKPYREAANWISGTPIPERVASMTVQSVDDEADCDVVFSGLDASVAGEVEAQFAQRGVPVVSNARNYRLDPTVPLLIPEVNPDHIELIDRQAWAGQDGESSGGYIVTNPNCSTVGLATALKPLDDAFGIEAVHVVTMQALSGAGYPGVSSLDILGNVVPHIGGEEEKMAVETRKLLGTLSDAGVTDAEIVVSAQCHRVPVLDGHMEAVSIRFRQPASASAVAATLRDWRPSITDLDLPTLPTRTLEVRADETFPQPRRHAGLGNGMTVSVGRIQPCLAIAPEGFGVKLVILSHNTVRGAAGGAILNAELLHAHGRLPARTAEEAA